MPPTPRLRSIDVLRGLVMVLMAIDHVRVYSGQPAGGPTAGIFFTRWVTHFCAPAFAFFAGTSAFLYGRRLGRTGALARALVTRGLVLVVLELTVIRVAWTFNVDFAHYLLAGVIWMLGVCMVLLAALVWLPMTAIAVFGLSVIFAQNLAGLVAQTLPEWAARFLYFGGVFTLGAGGPAVAVLYSIVPWIGVMAAGYAFGAIMIREPDATGPNLPADRSGCDRALPGRRRDWRPGAAGRSWRAAGIVPVVEPAEVPGFPVVPVDDARSDHRPSAASRARPRRRRRRAGRVRPRAAVLLPAAHPADSRGGAGRIARS